MAALLPLADVVVSTDVTNGGQERDDLNWGLNGELNTGAPRKHARGANQLLPNLDAGACQLRLICLAAYK